MAQNVSIVFDTSVVIDILRGVPQSLEYLLALQARAACSEITRAEVLRGVQAHEEDHTERFLQTFVWVTVDDTISRRAGEFGRRWDRSRPGIGIADFVVAATAQHLGLPLATRNVKHFPMFKGLRPPYRP